MIRRVAPLAFTLALLAFALPFATVSCEDAQVKASGAHLVLRTPPETEGRAPEGIDLGELVVAAGGGLATAAFLAFALGLLASARMWQSGWAPFAGVVGVAALVSSRPAAGRNTARTSMRRSAHSLRREQERRPRWRPARSGCVAVVRLFDPSLR